MFILVMLDFSIEVLYFKLSFSAFKLYIFKACFINLELLQILHIFSLSFGFQFFFLSKIFNLEFWRKLEVKSFNFFAKSNRTKHSNWPVVKSLICGYLRIASHGWNNSNWFKVNNWKNCLVLFGSSSIIIDQDLGEKILTITFQTWVMKECSFIKSVHFYVFVMMIWGQCSQEFSLSLISLSTLFLIFFSSRRVVEIL